MWLSSFWRSRNRFSLDELRYLADQLLKVQVVNEVNKDFVIEALRSIAELVTYGDQHDPSFFELFMEKQVMGEFARILGISTTPKVPLQLLQTMSIMIQNLRSERAIYYLFSNEHIDYLITYSFDFSNDELLSYYISFLRAISGKLNKNTISLLVKTENNEVVSFPLYVQAIRFAFHEENMIRAAVRALTLNVYHVGDETVNKFVSLSPQSDYFSKTVEHFSKQCMDLDVMTSPTTRKIDSSESRSCILTAVEEIEDNLYYFSDVVSAGVPDLARLITDNILRLLVFPLLLPSMQKHKSGAQIGIATSLYFLCCILRIFKTKDLANTIAVSLFSSAVFFATSEVTANGHASDQTVSEGPQKHDPVPFNTHIHTEDSSSLSPQPRLSFSQGDICHSNVTYRELLLSYIACGEELQVLGSLSLLATLLQTKELDESMLDGLGILPQRKQHKKLLLQALVGEDTGEEQLFSSNSMKDDMKTELDRYMLKLKDLYGLSFHQEEHEASHKMHTYRVLDALVRLFCRSDVPAEILWLGGWLLRQLLPHGEEEFTSVHLKSLKDSHSVSTSKLFKEVKGSWSDLLIAILKEEWRNCRRAIEAPSPPKDAKSLLFPLRISSDGESSFTAAERMCEMVKVFALQSELLLFSSGGSIPDLPPLDLPLDSPVYTRAKTSAFNFIVPKPGSEVSIANAVPCKIAFERGKERHFFFLALSSGTSGWLLLAEELPLKPQSGVTRVTAPLAGSDPKIDERHPKWLHLRIRPSTLPFLDSTKFDVFSKGKTKMVDGRWTLAFKDDLSCKEAESMILEEMRAQQSEVENRLKSLLKRNVPFDLQTCSSNMEIG